MSENITKKDVAHYIGYAIGLVGSGLIVATMYKILRRGYAHYIEHNPYLAFAEFCAGLGGVAFFLYKLFKG